MVAKEQQVGAHVAPGDGEDQGTASKDSAFKMPAMSNNGKSSPAPRSPAPCKQTGSSPIKKSKASASSSESDKKSSKKSASTDEFEEESDDDLFARVSSVQKMPSKSAAPSADADATKKTPSKSATSSSPAAKDTSSTHTAIPSKKAKYSASNVGSASAKKGKISKEEKDQEKGSASASDEKNVHPWQASGKIRARPLLAPLLSLALQGPPLKRQRSTSRIPREAQKLLCMFENDRQMDEQEQWAREITKEAEEVSKTWNNVSNRNNCGNRIDNSGGSSKPF